MKDSCTPPAHAAAATTLIPFHTSNPAGQPLFAVLPGVPLADALDNAYNLLDVAQGLTLRLSEPGPVDNEQLGHACTYLVAMAKATLRSCIEGMAQQAPPVGR
ncbi:DUF3077 domain-containing protein [Pseudomonas sp. GD03944]|uniref:DUF3077 domain-containing protein n=1 Tax=Pseudomonas sp. GD03944 TaxID=2975409 RepID=UPI0024476504|nr:DUF3077 domain-containing protein [Pseudomonas sp. GD03944]MDH1265021.1 DUF3077 domain-containing protein [Pseudomonas sp. GD03944]